MIESEIGKILNQALSGEKQAIKDYSDWAIEAESLSEPKTAKLFQEIGHDEEHHVAELTQEIREMVDRAEDMAIHILEHEACGDAKIIDRVKAENPDIPCKCFSFEENEYCWKSGLLGLISSKKNPEQISLCKIKLPASEGAQRRFTKIKGAIGEGHKEWEKGGGDLKEWWEQVGKTFKQKGIEV